MLHRVDVHPQIPDVLPCMSDTRWLQGQHLLITLKHKNGQVLALLLPSFDPQADMHLHTIFLQVLGQADVSLSDAYNYMAYPVTAESMNLVTVLDHPVLSPMWEAHVKKELSAENTAFFKATRAFQSWASGRECSRNLLLQ